jgi:hypothetical protein
MFAAERVVAAVCARQKIETTSAVVATVSTDCRENDHRQGGQRQDDECTGDPAVDLGDDQQQNQRADSKDHRRDVCLGNVFDQLDDFFECSAVALLDSQDPG